MPVQHPAAHILNTKGVTSEVKEDGEVVGHITLLDYDDSQGHDYSRLMKDCKDMPGLTAVFESSPGSWHVWNTTVRSFDQTALTMLSCKCDPMHISVGYRRGRWTLRFGPKNRANASAGREELPEEYKASPEPLQWWVNEPPNPILQQQSHGHINLICSLFGEEGIKDRLAERRTSPCGDHYRVEAYRTMTDKLKESIRANG